MRAHQGMAIERGKISGLNLVGHLIEDVAALKLSIEIDAHQLKDQERIGVDELT